MKIAIIGAGMGGLTGGALLLEKDMTFLYLKDNQI